MALLIQIGMCMVMTLCFASHALIKLSHYHRVVTRKHSLRVENPLYSFRRLPLNYSLTRKSWSQLNKSR